MNASSIKLERFLRRVYRRLVLLRLAEWAGIGFALGCGIALLCLFALRNRSDSPLLIAAAPLAGAAVGFVAALLRLPKILDAAVEADRQLDLADLLATAWQLEKSPAKESFEDAVLLIASDRASRLHPREVVLHRLGLRAWSGIGLAGALVLTVAIFTANPIDTEAAASPFLAPTASSKSQQDQNNARTANDLTTGHRPNITSDRPGGEDDPIAGAGKTDAATNAAHAQNTNTQTTNSNGAGSGSGQSHSMPDKSNATGSGVNSSRNNTNGKAASGVGNSSASANADSGNSTSTSAGNTTKSPTAPAWKSDSWPAAQQAADNAISTGQIPAAYHELVREYFKR